MNIMDIALLIYILFIVLIVSFMIYKLVNGRKCPNCGIKLCKRIRRD